MHKLSSISVLVAVILISALLGACAQSPAPQAGDSGDGPVIRMALLPILDTLPMYVAQQEGLFDKHDVKVEFIAAGSAPKRDELINAGQADGMINEVVSTLFYNKDETQVQIVRFARTAAADAPMFFILAAGNSGITTVDQLKGTEIGISQGTVIEYVTDRLLEAEGLTADDINTVAVPDIGQRMALLGSGELRAGTLPDPLASLAMQQGATLILDDTRHPGYSHSTYAFRKDFIDENPEAIRGFLAAVEEAVELINQDPQRWNSLLSEQQLVPEPLSGSFQVPAFVTASVPTQELWDDVLTWTKEKGLINVDVAYGESVNASFLP